MWLPRSRERPPRSSRALGAAAIEEAKLAHPSADEVRKLGPVAVERSSYSSRARWYVSAGCGVGGSTGPSPFSGWHPSSKKGGAGRRGDDEPLRRSGGIRIFLGRIIASSLPASATMVLVLIAVCLYHRYDARPPGLCRRGPSHPLLHRRLRRVPTLLENAWPAPGRWG